MKQTRVSYCLALLLFLIGTESFSLSIRDTIPKNNSAEDSLILDDDDPVLMRIDSLLAARGSSFLDGEYNRTPIDSSELQEFASISDSILELRMRAIDESTPFHLAYNKVVRGFVRLYVAKNKSLASNVIGDAKMYFPLFEEKLDKYGLPLELKYLAVVESALNPSAKSRAGACGLWQFMINTGKYYGLEVNSYVDERFDPYKSTDAACRYLRDLYNQYEDWDLALAAYNSGPGNVNKAIRRSGGKRDYWKIRPYLPRETSSYVPAFIAVNYLFAYAEEHGIQMVEPEWTFFECDTLMVCERLDLGTVSSFTDLSQEQIHELNPCYKLGVIPGDEEKHILRLPVKDIGLFTQNEEKIYEYQRKQKPKEPVVARETHAAKTTPKGDPISYRVRSGDVLGVIAEKHGVSVRSLRSWNNLRGSRIYPGQKLTIYPNKNIVEKARVQKQVEIDESSKYKYHVVRSGDTLWDIAKLYNGISVSQLKELNRGINFKRLRQGQKIKIEKIG